MASTTDSGPIPESAASSAEIQARQELQQKSDQSEVVAAGKLPEHGDNRRQKGMTFCSQCLLILAFVGTEMCMSFEQVYQVPIIVVSAGSHRNLPILSLQYLGTPLPMVTINGIICGTASIIIIPISGYMTDRGPDTMKRKRIAMFIGMLFFLIGLLLLIVCGFIKISSMDSLLQNITILSYNSSVMANNSDQPLVLTGNGTISTEETPQMSSDSVFPVTVFLSICGFALIDVGYDCSLAIVRAYILDSSPKFQHVRLLIMATFVQSLSGLLFCSIGVFNVSGALGNIFQVEGTSALLIFFCLLLFILVVMGFLSTMLTGYSLTKSEQKTDLGIDNGSLVQEDGTVHSGHDDVYKNKSFDPDLEGVEANVLPLDCNSKIVDNCKVRNNEMISKDTPGSIEQVETKGVIKSQEHTSQNKFSPVDKVQVRDFALSTRNLDQRNSMHGNAQPVTEEENETVNSSATHVDDNSPAETTGQDHISPTSEKKWTCHVPWMNKRLAILTTSTFFMDGGLLGFMYFGSNALTMGIYQGDPLALPGTEGKQNYEEGLRMASLGILCLYVVSTIISLSNQKILDILGAERQYILCQSLYIVAVLTLTLTQILELYFVAIIAVGAYRQCLFTVTFVMANKYTQPQNKDNNSSADVTAKSSNSNSGKVMSLLGFLMPAHYILISVLMAPVLEATADVWLPLLYGVGCTAVSLAVFLTSYLLK